MAKRIGILSTKQSGEYILLNRYKTILGKKLHARTEESREAETILGCKILNRFLELGRCESMLVA